MSGSTDDIYSDLSIDPAAILAMRTNGYGCACPEAATDKEMGAGTIREERDIEGWGRSFLHLRQFPYGGYWAPVQPCCTLFTCGSHALIWADDSQHIRQHPHNHPAWSMHQ
jgi:hypothetical protein